MIEQTAIVVDSNLHDKKIVVQTQIKSSCQACSSQSSCGTSLLSKIFNKQSNVLTLENTCDVKKGDYVLIGVTEKLMLQGSISLYLVPIIFILIFAFLGLNISKAFNLSNSINDLSILICSFVGFYLSRYLSNSTNPSKYQANLIKKLPQVKETQANQVINLI